MSKIRIFYQNHLKKKMFNKILLFYSMVMVLLFISVSILAYRYYEQRLVREQMDASLQELDIISISLNQQNERMYGAVQQIYTDAMIGDDLKYFLTHEYENFLKWRLNQYANSYRTERNSFDYHLRQLLKEEASISNIVLYSSDQDFFYVLNRETQHFYDQPPLSSEHQYWYERFRNQPWQYMGNEPLFKGKAIGESTPYSYVNVLKDPVTLKEYGAILFELNTDRIKGLLQEKLKNTSSRIMLITSQGQVIFDSQGRYDNTVYPYWKQITKPGDWVNLEERSKVQLLNIGNTGMVAAAIIPQSQIVQSLQTLRFSLTGIVILCIMISISVTFTVIRRYSKKIHRIIVYMRRWQEGDLSKRIKMEGEDELQQISQSFNHMCDRLESYIQTVYISEIKQKNAQLVALQAQINPHFLYNTLESIRMKAISSGARDVGQMIYILATMFRHLVKKQTHVTLAEEIELCGMYLALIQYRYENKLQVETNIEMAVAGSIVVKLLIQPIIENYIVHGFQADDDDNRISITAAEQGRHIIIRVKDNGKGIAPEKMTELHKALQSEGGAPLLSSDSLGLKNVHERIRLNYGSEYGISVISEQGKGCEVIIEIPFTRED
ncbi:two-component sensor histidine kinase [Paenibacillus helianthi]|uniref:histidine kinase n=1 Tax=Paenibacillus helianthi TaxID=1349432 RepID=A0ABX3ES30_9BACL|nr:MULTISPECIES: sensor histidine kinase [Paenibacillus]OKP71334.1 two-component sensor histidine kinase [Paenibacillus sp. P3E]OKP90338.1 two-component sensor histidine kinase [Paenibacillus sp. P32E]OKP90476.1 two-component sensor histidine kinase [Paenibacillus helianthi]